MKLTNAQRRFLETHDLMTGVCDEEGHSRTMLAAAHRLGLIEWRKHPYVWGGLRDAPFITDAGRAALAKRSVP